MSAAEIRGDIVSWWGEAPTAEVCLRIINFVSGLPISQAQFLTYNTLSNAAGKIKPDQELLAAVAVLTSSRVAALDTKVMFIDDDDVSFEIELEELAEAREAGELVHPETGDLVRDFEGQIVPFFVPTKRFLADDE